MSMIARAAGLVVLALLAGCASPDPTYYTLAARPGASVAGAPRSVVLRDVSLARYLDRPQIVRGTDEYKLDVSNVNWWGEPLGRMVGRVLIDDLTQRLPGSTIFPDSGAISAPADATVEVNIRNFAADQSGAVVLAAQVAVQRPGKPVATRAVQLSVQPPSGDTSGQVAAMSTALGQLADAVAGMLR